MATQNLVSAGQREVIVKGNSIRVQALLADAFHLLEKGKAKRDPAKALADAYWADPVGFLERVNRLAVPAAGAAAPGSTNIGQLFLQAVMGAQPQPQAAEPVTIEAEPVRVQSGSDDW
jgi:hypothetical protein